MIFIVSLIASACFILLCGKALRAYPAPFYAAAAGVSALVTALYWTAPAFLDLRLRSQLPLILGALGTACFVFVMFAGALPNGHPWMKRIMPIRGELSIFACLLTLGHNLSYGKNYMTPAFLFTGQFSTVKAAAWVSVILIVLMLVLTVTSIKAVRRRFSPKMWKSLQRWAYLFYALVYIHVLLLTVPGLLKGRSSYLTNLLVYSVVFLSYAVCRVQKAVLVRHGQTGKVTGRRQLAAAGAGVLLALLLAASVTLTGYFAREDEGTVEASGSETSEPAQPSAQPDAEQLPVQEDPQEPSYEPSAEISAEPEPSPEVPDAEAVPEPPEPEPTAAALPTGSEKPEPSPEPTPEPSTEPSSEPAPASRYKDGVFTGTGEGYNGPVTVSVTISDDRITEIAVLSHMDDSDYMGDAQTGVIAAILLMQRTDVSAVSGATYSSEGIMEAVAAALQAAAN